jgi:hypothetical protein
LFVGDDFNVVNTPLPNGRNLGYYRWVFFVKGLFCPPTPTILISTGRSLVANAFNWMVDAEFVDHFTTFFRTNNVLRTHTCGELNKTNSSQIVTLSGWVDRIRDHGGGKFIDLRDRYGRTQVVISSGASEAIWKIVDRLKNEFVIKVTGDVCERPVGQANPKLATGEIEVHVTAIEILNESETPPFLPNQKGPARRGPATEVPVPRSSPGEDAKDASVAKQDRQSHA